jgi:HlyD family secretion protein
MINNLRRPAWTAALVLLACGELAPAPVPGYQGVAELDTVTLAFEVTGKLEALKVDEGERLSGKRVLARLDQALVVPERSMRAAELEAQRAQLALLEAGSRREDVRAAVAELDSLREQEQVLARQRERQARLTASGAVPTAELDVFDAQASALAGRRSVAEERLRTLRGGARMEELMVARANVHALEAALAAIDARLSRHMLVHDGVADVLDVHVEAGEVVALGAPVLTLADLTHPFVDVFVPQAQLEGIAIGAEASVRVDARAAPFAGAVERVGYKTEFTPRYLFSEKERANLVVRVRVRIDDPERAIHAGVPAFVSFSRKAP